MSLNPLKHRFFSFFLVPPSFVAPLPCLFCCRCCSLPAGLFRLRHCFEIMVQFLFPFSLPFHRSLFFTLLLSVLRRFSLNCFRCLRYLAPLFRLFCPPVIHLFLFWLFFSRFLPFFSLVFDVSQNNFCLLLFFALDFSFLGVKRIENASFK